MAHIVRIRDVVGSGSAVLYAAMDSSVISFKLSNISRVDHVRFCYGQDCSAAEAWMWGWRWSGCAWGSGHGLALIKPLCRYSRVIVVKFERWNYMSTPEQCLRPRRTERYEDGVSDLCVEFRAKHLSCNT